MKKILFLALLVSLGLCGCKPTERNYKQAYDSALAKRQKAEAEAMIPATGLLSDEGPQQRIVGGDTLYVSTERLRPVSSDEPIAPYNVAVAMYKMNTNAISMAADLKAKGYAAQALKSTGDRWFTVAGGFPTLETARKFNKKFRKENPSFRYIGLPGAPVIIKTE